MAINPNSNEAMAALYGPAAAHSEHTRFTNVRYREDGEEHTGLIIWICAATADNPVQYVIEPAAGGFPEFVYSSDVLGCSAEDGTLHQ